MTDEDAPEFKMRLNDESSETELQQEVEDLRISKLNQRVTLISILIPCFFIAIIIFLYLDAKKEVTATFNSGSQEIQSLSKKIEARFSEVISQNEKQEADLKQNMAAFGKTLGDLTQTVADNSKAIKHLDSSKATKTSVSSSVTRMKASMDSLGSDLKDISNKINAFESRITVEMGAIGEDLDGQKKNTIALQADLSRLSESKIDRNDLQGSLADQKKALRQELDQQYKKIETMLIAVQAKISALEGGNPTLEVPSQNPKNNPDSVAPVKLSKPESAQTEKPSTKSALPQPGTIIEQDIQ